MDADRVFLNLLRARQPGKEGSDYRGNSRERKGQEKLYRDPNGKEGTGESDTHRPKSGPSRLFFPVNGNDSLAGAHANPGPGCFADTPGSGDKRVGTTRKHSF